MEWLNYHHLLYFWVVAREGGLQPAGEVLGLSHPTLSAQIHALEDRLGEKLFVKSGRRLALSEMGRVVYRYAEEIFTLGQEMVDVVQDRAAGHPLRFEVGVADAVPKLVVRRLLQPAFALPQPVRLICHEAGFEKLLADLSMHALDLVIADAPLPPGSAVRAYNHLLGECGVSFFGSEELAAAHRAEFPKSLDGAPILLPLETWPLRRALNQWFDACGVRPRVVAEFADSALLEVFGAEGKGLFAAPAVVESEVAAQYGVHIAGRTDEVRQRFYALTIERRLQHPAALAISKTARERLFTR
jgi:LysR family transcriptional activator of nhaA